MIDSALIEECIAIRRDLHQYPETGFDLTRTAEIVAAYLEKNGLSVRRGVGKSGVVADLVVPSAAKTIAFRADMDALPLQEERESAYKSKVSGKAHCCGHDLHTAILLGAAKLLSARKQSLPCNIRFIFQPSEEKHPGGAIAMIKENALASVSEAYALHVWPWIDTGTYGICQGAAMAQPDNFDITITGTGGHAASPHHTVDPIVVGSYLVSALQSIASRNLNPLEEAVITITQFHAGTAYNVIPSEARLAGTVRTYRPDIQKRIKQRMETLITSTAAAFNAESSFSYIEGYPPVINHENASKQLAGMLKAAGHSVLSPATKAMFGEDFAYFLQKVPGCFVQLGCRNEKAGCIYPLHHPMFNPDEECIQYGIALFWLLAQHASQPPLC